MSLSLHSCNNNHYYVLSSKVFNASEELALASKFPQVRIFMAALEQSDTELTDLAGVEVPWSVPTASMDRLIQSISSITCDFMQMIAVSQLTK